MAARFLLLVILGAGTAACGGGASGRQQPDAGIAIVASDARMATPWVVVNPLLSAALPDATLPTSALPAAPLPGISLVPQTLLAPASSPTPAATATSSESSAPTPEATPTPSATTTPAATATPAETQSSALTPTPTATPQAFTALTVATATPTAVPVQAATAGGSDMGSQALSLINQQRAAAGASPLRFNAALTTTATSYARLMAERNSFSHTGPDGSSPSSRMSVSGYAGRFKGEALAAGQSTAQSAVTTWMNSPSHRDIIMDRSAVEVGIGFASKSGTTYGTYWVLITGTP